MIRKPPSSTVERQARAFLEQHRGRPAIKPAPSAGRAVERVVRPLAKRFGVGAEQLSRNWIEIVGARLAAWSAPQAIERRGGVITLIVQARGPAGAVLQAESRRILERVKLYSGNPAPTRLRIVQGAMRARQAPATPQPRDPAEQSGTSLESNAESRLSAALAKFDRSVKRRQDR